MIAAPPGVMILGPSIERVRPSPAHQFPSIASARARRAEEAGGYGETDEHARAIPDRRARLSSRRGPRTANFRPITHRIPPVMWTTSILKWAIHDPRILE